MQLQLNASCVVSIVEPSPKEASLSDLPAVTIKNVHERPEGMDVGVIMSGFEKAQCPEGSENSVATNRRKR